MKRDPDFAVFDDEVPSPCVVQLVKTFTVRACCQLQVVNEDGINHDVRLWSLVPVTVVLKYHNVERAQGTKVSCIMFGTWQKQKGPWRQDSFVVARVILASNFGFRGLHRFTKVLKLKDRLSTAIERDLQQHWEPLDVPGDPQHGQVKGAQHQLNPKVYRGPTWSERRQLEVRLEDQALPHKSSIGRGLALSSVPVTVRKKVRWGPLGTLESSMRRYAELYVAYLRESPYVAESFR